MNKKLLLFGAGKIAEVIYYYAKEECGFEVAAFTVDDAYKTGDTFDDLPVVPFSQVAEKYPPSEYDMFVAVGYHDLNKLRETKCREAEEKGYKLVNVISPLCNVPRNVAVGKNCFIMPPALIHPRVTLGDNVFVWSGSIVGHHSVIGNNAWITSGCNIAGNVSVGENCFFAINATLAHSISVGKDNFIGANVLLTKNTLDGQVYIAESSKAIKLNSTQFLKFSKFSTL